MPFTQHHAVAAFVDALAGAGLAHACIAPGARSTPLALCLAAHPAVRVWSHVDERSAAFFALGLAKRTWRPTAVVCTSGTAAANCFPAVVEAAYAHLPLVVVTADRPPELRDCGAPQTIDQIKLYGDVVKWFAEVGDPACGERYFRALAERAVLTSAEVPAGPVHLNVPLREPLTPPPEILAALKRSSPRPEHGARSTEHGPESMRSTAESVLRVPSSLLSTVGGETPAPLLHAAARVPTSETVATLTGLLRAHPHGIVVCGPRDTLPAEAAAVLQLAAMLGYPVLADPTANIATDLDADGLVDAYDVVLRDATIAEVLRPDVVVRIGALPTSKALSILLRDRWHCPHVVVDPLGAWDDLLRRPGDRVRADVQATCAALVGALQTTERTTDPGWRAMWAAAGRRARDSLAARLVPMAELFEGKAVAILARVVPAHACLYVGNSMAIRDVEAFWPAGGRRPRMLTNRGVNGIDGFVSSVLGAAAADGGAAHDAPVVALTGDLGFYHDLNGLLAAKRYRVRATMVVLNNDGGGIFSYLPQAECGADFEELFLTPHGLDFRGAVEMYDCRFVRIASWEQFASELTASLTALRTTVIEVPVDRARSVALHRELFAQAAAAARDGLG